MVGRINWMRRSVGEIGRGRGDGVIAEPASSETENWYLVRGFMRGASSETENRFPIRGPFVRGLERGGESVGHPRPRARRRVGGPGQGRGLANSCLLALIFKGFKQLALALA